MLDGKIEIIGTITKVFEAKTIPTGQTLQQVNIELDTQFEKAVPIEFWEDKIATFEDARVHEGDKLRCEIYYNGKEKKDGKYAFKIYPSFRCVMIEKLNEDGDQFIDDDDFPRDTFHDLN